MEGVEGIDTYNEVIDDFYVVDAWSEKQGPDVNYNSTSGGENIDVSSAKEGCIPRKKQPTEGEIDEFLENLKELNSKCGTSGLENDGNYYFKSTKPNSKMLKIPEESNRDTLCPVKCQGEIHFSDNQFTYTYTETVQRSKPATVSYKPGGTLTKTFFPESSVKAFDFSSSFSNNQEIGISSSDALFYVSIDQNEDSGGAFSDVKGPNYSSEPCESQITDRTADQQRRIRSRSLLRNSLISSSKHPSNKESNRHPLWERNRNTQMDVSRNNRNNSRDGRPRDDLRRPRRSGSRSRERHHHRSRSPRRLYRPSISLSPSPPKREVVNEDKMEPRHPPSYYQSSGFRDDYGPKGSMPSNPAFMNPNMNSNVRMPVPPVSGPDPVQYPINPSNTYGRFPGYNPTPNMFNNGPPQPHGFQPQMLQNFPQNQYPQPQNFPGFNPSVQMGIHENPPNPVPFPSSWNQAGHGFNENYSMSNIPTAVTYPHLKIGQPRVDMFGNNQEKSDGSPQLKHCKSSSEKLKYSRSKSPDSKKHKRKSSKRLSKSPVSNRKYEERDRRHERNSRSPIVHFRFETKRPRVIIDPNRIPTPPPPPIVGSYDKDDARKSNDHRAKIPDLKINKDDPLSDFLNKDKVSLSCLLEAVMENSGQGKSQLSNPKVKREIISKCESKIRHLYKRRMTGLGAFIPDPIQSSSLIALVSPLVAVCSRITYNCEEEDKDWHCPGIIIPEVKKKVEPDFSAMQHDLDCVGKLGIENPTVIPTLTNNQNLSKQNWGSNLPQHLPNHNTFTHVHENNRQNMFPSYQPHQNWINPVSPQNQYPVRPLMPSHVSEIPTLGAASRPPGYSFNMHPRPEFMSPHQGYPSQPGMLTYPPRVNYPPMHPLPPQNLNHPGMYRMLQPDPSTNNYQFNADDPPKSKKNKNNVNNNLIILNNPISRPGSVQKTNQKDEKVSRNINFTDENNLTRNKMENSDDNNKMPRGTNEAKDKLLRKLWQLRKSSDYVHVPVDQQCTKEQDNEFYQKLNYAEMQEDTQLDTIHDYQLVNLRERIETCLAEGKVPPDLQHRSSDRRIGDKDRERERQREKERGRDRERDRTKERERSRRDPNDNDRKRHGRSPTGDERKKYRSDESHHDRRRSRESSSQKEQGNKSNKEEVIEILSDDDHKNKAFDENLTSEGLGKQNEKVEPSEKTITTLIFDLLGPEIRKTQEKSDLYKSIIDSLEYGDRAYKRLYSFRNTALIKSDKDNKMKMVVPRDNLKDVVTAIHKNFHNIQSEELSKLLKDLIYPNMFHIPKCISKVVSECLACIELKKKEEISKDKKADKGEKKPEKRIDRLVRDRDKDKKSSHDRDKRISKDRSLSSSKGRRDLSRSVRERDVKDSSVNDGRPSGYEKATKVRKLGPAETSKGMVCAEPLEEKCKDQPEDKSSQVLHGLNDKALEFKNTSDQNIEESREKSVDAENANPSTDEKVNENEMASSSDLSINNLDDQNQDLKTESPTTKVEVSNGGVVPISETTKDNTNPPDNSSKSASEGNMKSNRKEVKDNVIEEQDKASSNTKANVAENKDAPILDFKGRVRQVQMSSSDFRDIITSLESLGDGNLVDQSYLMKGGMLCRKNAAKNASEVKIVAPPDQLEDLVNIVHTMSPVHTPAAKVVIFFSKHFTPVDNLDLKVNEFVNTCSSCKVKGS